MLMKHGDDLPDINFEYILDKELRKLIPKMIPQPCGSSSSMDRNHLVTARALKEAYRRGYENGRREATLQQRGSKEESPAVALQALS